MASRGIRQDHETPDPRALLSRVDADVGGQPVVLVLAELIRIVEGERLLKRRGRRRRGPARAMRAFAAATPASAPIVDSPRFRNTDRRRSAASRRAAPAAPSTACSYVASVANSRDSASTQPDAEPPHAAVGARLNVASRAAEHDERVVDIGQRAEPDQPRESRGIAVVRRRGQQDDAASVGRDRPAGVVAIGVAARGVSLVDHDQIPRARRQRVDHVRLFQIVERRDPDARPRPRVVAGRARPSARVKLRAIGVRDTGFETVAAARRSTDRRATRARRRACATPGRAGRSRRRRSRLVSSCRVRPRRRSALDARRQSRRRPARADERGCRRPRRRATRSSDRRTSGRARSARRASACRGGAYRRRPARLDDTGRSNGARNVARRSRATTSYRTTSAWRRIRSTRHRRCRIHTWSPVFGSEVCTNCNPPAAIH